ncbi:MAG: lipopolysaccharide biosynthesis protein [Candidatus Thorarchaeota archaeon]|jgi:O-antigen/teichoic acid export membrane protein
MTVKEGEAVLRTRLGRHATAGLSAAIIVRGMGIVLVKILSTFLTKTEYGTYSLWLALVFLLSTISTSPFSATLWRYLQKKRLDEPKDASRLLALSIFGAFFTIIAIYLGLYLAFFLFNFRIVEDAIYLSTLLISGILTVFYILKELILVVSGTEQNSREIFAFNITFGVGANAVAAIMAILFDNLFLVLVGLCIGYSIPVFVSLVLKMKQYGIAKFGRSEFRLTTEYGGPILVANSSSNSIAFLTSFLVSIWIGLSGVGTLSIAQAIAALLTFIIGPVVMAYNAYMIMTFETADFEKGNKLTTKLVELYISFVTPVVWIVVVFSSFLIELISTGDYLDSGILLPYTALAAAILAFSQFWRVRINLVQKTYLAAIVYGLSTVVLIVSSALFLEIYGLVGIGFGILTHSIVVLIGMYVTGNRDLPISLRSYYFASWSIALVGLFVTDMLLKGIGLSSMIAGALASGVYMVILVATRGVKLKEVWTILQVILPGRKSKVKAEAITEVE